jgi:hypothetical protein
MKDDGERRPTVRGRLKPTLEATGGAGEDDLRHPAIPFKLRRSRVIYQRPLANQENWH